MNFRFNPIITVLIALVFFVVAGLAYATHSWGSYHWARTANPFNLKLGDNVSSIWDTHLGTASSDWSVSSVLDTTVVAGGTKPASCKPTPGRVEVCDSKYGNNGWLGVAQIWVNSDSHIVQGAVKLNDSYFNTTKYNKPEWRQFVMCQEIGHTFGLDHQDENFTNTNLGTCMDYTNDPSGALYNQLSNEHPNQHDYDELGIIYTHLDSTTTVGQTVSSKGSGSNTDAEDPGDFGKGLRKDSRGRTSLFEKDLGKGDKVFTFVLWAD